MADDLFRKIPEKKLTNIDQATLIIKKEKRLDTRVKDNVFFE